MRARPLALLLGGMLAAAAGCSSSASLDPQWRKIEPRPEAPAFSLRQLDGPIVKLGDYRGQVVVLDFWATWCGPCRQSLPSLEQIARRFRERGVAVLLINEGEEAERVRRWVERRFTTPILLDTQQEVAERYGVSGIPSTFIVDQQGRIAYTHGGYGGGLERNLSLILEELLSSPAASGTVR